MNVLKKTFPATFFALFLALLFAGSASAQRTVTGTVTDAESGETIPGVNILLEGTQQGTQTDVDGRYAIDIPEDSPAGGDQNVLVFSFVGYETTEEVVGERDVVDVAMAPSVSELETVVVSGYRAQTKLEETGAITRVGSDQIENQSVQSAEGALQGRAAGVRVTSASGQPGAGFQVQVRGNGSITAGNAPLYIVDGVQFGNNNTSNLASSNPLASINPDDIESIEVLKDAAAKAIYGAQASNGVVLISTKQGRPGETRVTFRSRLGTVGRLKTFDVLNSNQYAQFQREAYLNRYGSGPLTRLDRDGDGVAEVVTTRQYTDALFGNPGEELRSTDWQDAVYRSGMTQNYSLQASGGDETTRFFLSGAYEDTEGQIVASDFSKGSFKANLDHDVTDDLSVSVRANLATLNYRGTISDGPFISSPFWSAQFINPAETVYNINPETGEPDRSFGFNPLGGTFSFNPVQQETFNTRDTNINQLFGSFSLNYRILDGLFARTLAGLQHEDVQEQNVDDPRLPANQEVGGSVFGNAERTTSFNISQTFPFDTRLGSSDQHSFSVLGGAEYRYEFQDDVSASGDGIPNEFFRSLANTSANQQVGAFETEYSFLSFFGDAEFIYDDRYVIKGVARTDGSSRFGADNQWGLFFSGSAGWRIANEAFMEEVDFVDLLTLRGSYGETGNSLIGNFASRALFGGFNAYNGTSGIRPNGLANPQLTWETNRELNFGLDYALFAGRLSGSVDVYQQIYDNLLLGRDLPIDSGFGSVTENVGRTRVQGVEVNVSTVNLNVGDFRWDTNFNISFQRNEVLELTGDDEEINVGGAIFREGEPLRQAQYARYAGVNPADGRPLYFDENGNYTYFYQEADLELVGSVDPDFYGGLGNTLAYKGLNLEVFFQYDYGRQTLNNNRFFNELQSGFNKNTDFFNRRWQRPGDVTDVPVPYQGGAIPFGNSTDSFTTRYFEDASYIRLKRVRLGYQLPSSLTNFVDRLQRLELFVQGRNLVTFTNFTGYDPEVVGTALGEYPQGRTLTAGLNLSL